MRTVGLLTFTAGVWGALAAAPSPGDALKMMRVPPEFEVTVVASEPAIRQPLSVSFDGRGRMWVLQYLQYPTPAGLKPVSVDQYLRTKYDRVPEPPPKGPKGVDRITITEDSNGDGLPDRFKDFLSNLNLASGFALAPNGVYVVQPPYLLFYADTNHDDLPDGDPKVLLEGFGMDDSHALANSLTWGPDGWLYGAQGSTVTSKIRGHEFQQGIWRFHPVTEEFELFAEGGGNTWGLDFDEDGEVIAGTNFGEQIALHQVQGGYYVKGFAKHGPLHNPHTYGYLDHIPYSGWKGGRVVCGGIVYQGGALGPQVENSYVAANLLRRTIDWHYLERSGSSFQAHYGGSFIETEDTTFRPVDCTTGPDGAVYVCDWCDARASHVDPVDNWDKTTGRIYRIGLRGQQNRERFDLGQFSAEQLVSVLTNRNDWFRREARSFLAQRHTPAAVTLLQERAVQAKDGRAALESLWALAGCGAFNEPTAIRLLGSPHEAVRMWAVRLIGDTRQISPALSRRIGELARGENGPVVRSQLACSAKRWAAAESIPIVRELLRHDEDVKDSQIPLLLWWAIEDKAIAHPRETLGVLATAADWDRPLMRTHILERIARRYASETNEPGPQTCAWLLSTAPTPELRERVLRGLDAAWQGRMAPDNALLRDTFSRYWKGDDALATRVGLRLGFSDARKSVLAGVTNSALAEKQRTALAEVIGECRVDDGIRVLTILLRQSPKLQIAAIAALQNFNEPAAAQALLDAYANLTADARTRARTALASRPSWAIELVAAVNAGRIDPKSVTADQLQQMVRHENPELTAAIEKRWGRMQPQSSAEKLSTINTLKLVLNPSGTTHRFKGDIAAGKQLFQQICGTCHKLYGEGNSIGPELTGSDRKNTEWLLTQVVDPNAFIRPEYVNHNVEMKDGRSLTGLLAEQTSSAITVLDAQNQRTIVNRSEILEVAPSAISLMPEGLLEPLQPQQVRDLFSYLQEH